MDNEFLASWLEATIQADKLGSSHVLIETSDLRQLIMEVQRLRREHHSKESSYFSWHKGSIADGTQGMRRGE